MYKILNWIDNSEEKPLGGQFFYKRSPITGEKIGMVASSGKVDVERAFLSARKAFGGWSRTPILERAGIIKKAGDILDNQKNKIVERLKHELGLSSRQLGISMSDSAGFWAEKATGAWGSVTNSKIENRFVYTTRVPCGVIAVLTPFNVPFDERNIFPALLCGNTVVMKAASDAPSAPMFLARALRDAGLPSGVFSVLHGRGSDIGPRLVLNDEVDVISFTGSLSVGKCIEKLVVDRKDKFIKLSLELGGKNPIIVCDDSDLELAARCCVASSFSNAGQRCASSSRIIIAAGVYGEFKNLFVKKTKRLKMGVDDDSDMGPVINDEQHKNILSDLGIVISQGARLLCGGKKPADLSAGYFIEPTILENISSKDAFSQKEIFGPVAILYKVKNLSDAISLANDSKFGLTASIFTKDLDKSGLFIREILAGVAYVNGNTFGAESNMPFGGMKNSGNGTRLGGVCPLDFFSQLKTVGINYR